jgi:hypothetical protein
LYGVFVLPAILTAAFAWPVWVGLALLVPGEVLRIGTGWAAAKALGIASRSETGQLLVYVIAVPGAIVLSAVAKNFPRQYYALFYVCYLIIVVDPLWRLIYHRSRTGTAVRLKSGS